MEEHISGASEEVLLDNRAQTMKDEFLKLIDAAQGIWKDAFESQIRLSNKADALQVSIDQIKEFSALPTYPNGMASLERTTNRIKEANRRLVSVSARLTRLETALAQPKHN